jgi:hypothetical protein
MASAKVRQLEDNLAFRYVTESDRPTNIEDLEKVLLRNQERALKESYALHGTIGPNPIYDEEGNIIPQELWAPDLALTPFMSPKNLANLLKDFTGKAKSIIKTPNKTQALKDVVIKTGAKLSEKLTPSIAKKTGTLGYGKPTLFAKYLEGRSKKNLYNKLSTKEEFNKFITTFDSSYKGKTKDIDFKNYKDWLKDLIFKGEEIKHAYGKQFFPWDDKQAAIGLFSPLQGSPGGKGTITMASKLTPSQWGSTLRHELKHKLDYSKTGLGNEAYKNLKKIFKDKMKPEPKKKLEAWEQVKMAGKHFTGRDVADPKDVARIKYLSDPTETLARSTQLKTKGIGQTISETLNVPSKPRRELEEIYTKEFIKELMDKYWAGAVPVGLGLDEDLFKEVKE